MKRYHNMKALGMLLGAALAMPLLAQQDVPLLRPEEKAVLDRQDEQFNRVVESALESAAKSTVRIWSGKYRLAYGTVIGDGRQVLTKWSEVDRQLKEPLVVESSEGRVHPATIVGVYADQDLAVLKIGGEPLAPVVWSRDDPALGSFLIATQPNGRMAGFGVVSVLERNLRKSDQAFLGVVSDPDFGGPGVLVRQVSEGSGAAKAGIKPGDVILKVGEREISGLMELKNALVNVNPGDTVSLQVKRAEHTKRVDALLGNRPDYPNYLGGRLAAMERMGTRISRIRDTFPNAIQTDLDIEPNQVGGPVVNVKGEVVGVTLARAGRTRSFIMPALALQELLKEECQDPVLARADLEKQRAQADNAVAQNKPRAKQGQGPTPEQLENHLQQMRRLMRMLEFEMDELEGR